MIRPPPLPPSTNVGAGTLLAGAPSGSQGMFRVPGGPGFLDLGAGSSAGPVERSGIGGISGIGAPREPGVASGFHQGVLPQLGGSQGLGGAQRGAGIAELGENVGGNVVRPEEPARYISELPKLSQSDLANSAVVCGNWLAQVRQIMVGLSTSASVWWEGVERPATAAYRRWLVADPLGRLSIDPSTVIGEFDRSLYGRVESRSVSLLLAAVPQSIRDDVVTNRWLSSAAVLFRVLCLFQPGGSSERSHLLSQLVSPSVCKTFAEAVKGLRTWQQGLQRAGEIHATLPDPSLLLRGVDTSTSSLLAAHPMIGFRVNAFRHQLAIDYNPTVASVVQLVRLIQAECEAASIAGDNNADKRAKAAAAIAAKEQVVTPAAPKASPTPPSLPAGSQVAAVATREMSRLRTGGPYPTRLSPCAG